MTRLRKFANAASTLLATTACVVATSITGGNGRTSYINVAIQNCKRKGLPISIDEVPKYDGLSALVEVLRPRPLDLEKQKRCRHHNL